MLTFLRGLVARCWYGADIGLPEKESDAMKLYVGGLAADVTDAQLMEEFSAYGQVDSAETILDRFSGTPRGFGFVEMPSKDEAIAAINGLNGKELNGKILEVNEARPKPSRASRPHGGEQRRGDDRRGGGRRGGGRRGGGRRGGRDRDSGGDRRRF
jgi:RNA recognition motif-containing protein